MVLGYSDGTKLKKFNPSEVSSSYIHGWKNGRDDKRKRARSKVKTLREQAEFCESLDNLAGIDIYGGYD